MTKRRRKGGGLCLAWGSLNCVIRWHHSRPLAEYENCGKCGLRSLSAESIPSSSSVGSKRKRNVTLHTEGRLNPSRSALKQNPAPHWYAPCAFSLCTDWIVLFRWHEEPVYRRERNGALTLLRRGDGDGLRRELLVEIPGVRFRRDLRHERRDQLDREELIIHNHVQIKCAWTNIHYEIGLFCSSRRHLCDQNTVKPGILLNTIYTYSGYGKYSDPLKLFTLCYIAAIC